MSIQFPQHNFLKRWFSLLCIFLASLLMISWPYLLGFSYRLSIMLQWSSGLFVCQCCAVLSTVALWNILKSQILYIQLCYSSDCFGYCGSSVVSYIRIFSIPVRKNDFLNHDFDGDWICRSVWVVRTVTCFNLWAQSFFPFICVSQFLSLLFCCLQGTNLWRLCYFILNNFTLFGVIVNEAVFWISF